MLLLRSLSYLLHAYIRFGLTLFIPVLQMFVFHVAIQLVTSLHFLHSHQTPYALPLPLTFT